MVRASPCDYYLKFLCSHTDGYKDEQIKTLVKMQHLDFLGMGHLQRIRETCVPPTPFYPEQETHHQSQRFLVANKIRNLYHPDEDTLSAIKLLDSPRGKEMVENMLFSGAEPLWISMMLKRIQIHVSERAIELYRHYYFNTDLVSSIELRAIMGMRADQDVNVNDSDELSFRDAYRQASKSEIASLSTNSQLSPYSRIMSLLRMGVMPSTTQISRIVTAGRTAAVVRSLENTILGRAEQARDFALTGKILNELLESIGDASGDLQKNLMSIALQTDSSEVPQLEEITNGQHSIDLLPSDTITVGPEEDEDEDEYGE